EVFLRNARFPDGIRELLERLARRRPLAVLSNFFMTPPVEAVLRRADLFDLFRHVEVSATSGFMKPHPAPFGIVLEELGTPAERTLMVGDDYWADVVGGHRAGLLTALTQEHRQGPTSDPRTPDIAADRVIRSVAELLED
ncbi:MAG: HAD family hydrolase, partial [Planctomycetota bacterium]